MDLSRLMDRLTLRNEACARSSIKCKCLDINENKTDIACFECDQEILVIATQHGKTGCLIKVEREEFETDLGTKNVYGIKNLFGDVSIEKEAVARYIAECLNTKKPLIMSVNLIECTKLVADEIISVLKQLLEQV